MEIQSYHFEISDLISQFLHAFDGAIVNRYDKSRNVVDRIAVRYVYSPKQRVLHDLINKAQHITLPCVAIKIDSITRDVNRVFNKIYGTPYNFTRSKSGHMLQPLPVNIAVSVSVLTRYQRDMDQILQNFTVWSDPYFVISWKREGLPYEIRTEVDWSGSINLDYPVDINNSQPTRITADTSFTIKGWLFKNDDAPIGNIFKIDTNFSSVNKFKNILTMADERTEDNTDTLYIEARPKISFITPHTVSMSRAQDVEIELFGENFNFNNTRLFLKGNEDVLGVVEQFNLSKGSGMVSKYPPFNGVEIDFTIESDNKLVFKLPELHHKGLLDVIVSNNAGYGKLTVDTSREYLEYDFPFSRGLIIT